MELAAAIDGGTTNTRARIFRGESLLASASLPCGARDVAIAGAKDQLRRGIAQCLANATASAGITPSDIRHICASGMLTSNVGLLEVPHVLAPAALETLAAHVRRANFHDIAPSPIHFVPGVKTITGAATLDNLGGIDILRGEESEAFGILEITGRSGSLCILLPGSHTKLVLIDEQRRIAASYTTIGGELLQALAQHTILAGSITWPTTGTPDLSAVQAGARCAEQWGLLRGGFAVRLADVVIRAPAAERTWLFVGLVAGSDWTDLVRWTATPQHPPLLVGGREPLRSVYGFLAKQHWRDDVEVLPDSIVEFASARGALAISRAATK